MNLFCSIRSDQIYSKEEGRPRKMYSDKNKISFAFLFFPFSKLHYWFVLLHFLFFSCSNGHKKSRQIIWHFTSRIAYPHVIIIHLVSCDVCTVFRVFPPSFTIHHTHTFHIKVQLIFPSFLFSSLFSDWKQSCQPSKNYLPACNVSKRMYLTK